jgi:VWFA-related protein
MVNQKVLHAFTILLAASLQPQAVPTQNPASSTPQPAIPTLKLSSQLVFLDITVVNRRGQLVTSGLTQNDFLITEDKKPQRIRSFQPPEAHVLSPSHDDAAEDETVAVFVLDELNSNFEDTAYYRTCLRKYLDQQPAMLAAPAELMVLSSYYPPEIVQGFTRDRDDLLSALGHIEGELPGANVNPDDQVRETFAALEGIALEGMGGKARKTVVWLGSGIVIPAYRMEAGDRRKLDRYMRLMTNTLVDGRITLYAIYPGLEGEAASTLIGPDRFKEHDVDVKDPYGDVIKFYSLAHETGGAVYANSNFLEQQMTAALDAGLRYYTLTYRPEDVPTDSKFRQIRVAMRNPNLRAITKTGYYAPDAQDAAEPSHQAFFQMSQAAQSQLPLDELQVSVENIVRHPDFATADFTLRTTPNNLAWNTLDDGRSSVTLGIVGLSLAPRGGILASNSGSTNSSPPRRTLSLSVTSVPPSVSRSTSRARPDACGLSCAI